MTNVSTAMYAVRCPETRDYFLMGGKTVTEMPVISKLSGNRIPPEELYVQYLPQDDVITFRKKEIRSFLKMWDELLPDNSPLADLKNDWVPNVMKNVDAEAASISESFHPRDIPAGTGRPEGYSDEVARGVFGAAVATELATYKASYLEINNALHDVTLDRWGDSLVVFNLGQGGSAMFAFPLASFDAKDVAKIAVSAALLAEIISLIGRLLGVKPNLNKAREAIQEKLQDSRVIQAILRFLHRVGEAGESASKSVLELIKDLWQLGALQHMVWPALAGAFGFWALLWALGKLMAKILVPAIGVAMVAVEIGIVMAGLAAKIAKLLE